MITNQFNQPFDHILFEDFFDNDQLSVVWDELNFIIKNDNFISKGPVDSDATENTEGIEGIIQNKKQSLAKRHSFFIDECFINHRETSNIYKFIQKKLFFSNLHVKYDRSILAQYLPITNHDSLLVSLYNSEDYYKSHIDKSVLTFIVYLYYKKNHIGGDLIFNDYDFTFTPKHNNAILFPSCLAHSVTPIITDEDNDSPYQRISITLFVGLALDYMFKRR